MGLSSRPGMRQKPRCALTTLTTDCSRWLHARTRLLPANHHLLKAFRSIRKGLSKATGLSGVLSKKSRPHSPPSTVQQHKRSQRSALRPTPAFAFDGSTNGYFSEVMGTYFFVEGQSYFVHESEDFYCYAFEVPGSGPEHPSTALWVIGHTLHDANGYFVGAVRRPHEPPTAVLIWATHAPGTVTWIVQPDVRAVASPSTSVCPRQFSGVWVQSSPPTNLDVFTEARARVGDEAGPESAPGPGPEPGGGAGAGAGAGVARDWARMSASTTISCAASLASTGSNPENPPKEEIKITGALVDILTHVTVDGLRGKRVMSFKMGDDFTWRAPHLTGTHEPLLAVATYEVLGGGLVITGYEPTTRERRVRIERQVTAIDEGGARMSVVERVTTADDPGGEGPANWNRREYARHE